jgi:hypothetical protein
LAREKLELEVKKVPVFIDDNRNPVETALASCIARRNLTSSGIALTLFEAHPQLKTEREARGHTNLMRSKMFVSEKEFEKLDFPSFKILAIQYNVPREYFSYLARLWDSIEEKDDWDTLVQQPILNGHNVLAVLRGFQGRDATLGKDRTKPDYFLLLTNTLTKQLPSQFRHWLDLNGKQRDQIIQDFMGTLEKWPKSDGLRIAERMMEYFKAECAKEAIKEAKNREKEQKRATNRSH